MSFNKQNKVGKFEGHTNCVIILCVHNSPNRVMKEICVKIRYGDIHISLCGYLKYKYLIVFWVEYMITFKLVIQYK